MQKPTAADRAAIDRLRAVARDTGQSHRELSGLAGLAPSHLHQILAGDVTRVTLHVASGIARATGVSVGWLLAGEGTAPRPEAIRACVIAAINARDERAGRAA